MTAATTITASQHELLNTAAHNHGVIFVGDWVKPAIIRDAHALTQHGLLKAGTGRNQAHRRITPAGRQYLATVGLN